MLRVPAKLRTWYTAASSPPLSKRDGGLRARLLFLDLDADILPVSTLLLITGCCLCKCAINGYLTRRGATVVTRMLPGVVKGLHQNEMGAVRWWAHTGVGVSIVRYKMCRVNSGTGRDGEMYTFWQMSQ